MRTLGPLASWMTTCLMLVLAGCAGGLDPLPASVDDEESARVAIDQSTDDATDVAAAVEDVAVDPNAPVCAAIGAPATTTQKELLDALNQYRLENGLSPLVYSKRLEAAADTQVRDLWERSYFAHINPDGQDPGERAVAAGFCHQYVGENLAAGQTTVAGAMTAWKNSPGHNANMLEPQYVYVGVGVSSDANGRLYWAQEFAYELP